MIHYTYWIIDNINNMYYHGVHSSIEPNNIKAYRGSSKILKAQIRKYGIENFEKRIERTFNTREEANKWEQHVHNRLNVANHPKFYNMINGHYKHHRKLTDDHKLVLFSKEARRKHSLKKTGRKHPHTDEWNKNISIAKKGKRFSKEHKQALSVPKKLSKEQRKIFSENCKSRFSGFNNPNIKKAKPFIVWHIETLETFFVISAKHFGKDILNKTALNTKLNAIAQGKRNQAYNYTARYATNDEIDLYYDMLFNQGKFYIEINIE